MSNEQNNKKIDFALKKFQASLLVKHDCFINENQKENIIKIMEKLYTYYVLNRNRNNEIQYYTMLSFKKKKINIAISINYSTPSIRILDKLAKERLNLYYCDGISYKNINDVSENIELKAFNSQIKVIFSPEEFSKINIKTMIEKNQIQDNLKFFPEYEEIYKLFIKERPLSKKYEKLLKGVVNKTSGGYNPKTLYFIDKVWEYKDRRWAYLISYENGESKLTIITVTPNNAVYNYIDENRFIMYMRNSYQSNTFIAFDIIENIEDDFKELFISYLRFISRMDKLDMLNTFYNTQLSNDDVLSNSNRIALEESKQEREQKIIKMKNLKYEEAIENLDKKPLIKNGISFSKYSMLYENINVDTNKIFNFSNYLSSKSVDDIADFNTILNSITNTICVYFLIDYPTYSDFENINKDRYSMNKNYLEDSKELFNSKTITINIDNKEISLKKENSFYYVNNIRINKKEIPIVLRHILCYSDIEKYNEFLKSVSSCSMKFHNAIANNIKKEVGYYSNTDILELKMQREKSRNFLVLGKNKYSIKDTNRLIDTSVNNMEAFVLLLMDTVNIPINKINLIIKESKDRYTNAIKKSKELLKKTLDLFKIKEVTISNTTGYKITGKSGNEYLVEKENLKVWEIKGDNLDYRCIVDKTRKGQIGQDALVSRIYALANDTLVANEVYTLRV